MNEKYSKVLTVLGGRKFIFGSALLAVICALFASGNLSEPGFIELVKWTATGYLAANGLAKAGGRKNG